MQANPKWDDPDQSTRFLEAAERAAASNDPKDLAAITRLRTKETKPQMWRPARPIPPGFPDHPLAKKSAMPNTVNPPKRGRQMRVPPQFLSFSAREPSSFTNSFSAMEAGTGKSLGFLILEMSTLSDFISASRSTRK